MPLAFQIDPDIDPNTVLKHTLFPEIIIKRPNVIPISVEWRHVVLTHSEFAYEIGIEGKIFNLSDSELNAVDVPIESDLRFSLETDDYIIEFDLELGQRLIDEKMEPYFLVKKISEQQVTISYGRKISESIEDFFNRYTPIIWFADGSQLFQNRYVKLKEQVGHVPEENILTATWVGVSIQKESQGIYPYIKDSIQHYFISKIIDDFEIVYDDDGSGEIADIIGINNFDKYIDIHLYHLKYAKNGRIGNDIDNLYQVCGQAQKSLNWKYRKGKDFFDHLLSRKIKVRNDQSCTRIVKGNEEELETLLGSANGIKKWYSIFI